MCLKTLENLTVLQILIDLSYHLTRKLTGHLMCWQLKESPKLVQTNNFGAEDGWVCGSTKHQLLKNAGLGLFACGCLHGNFLSRGKF